MSDLDYGERKIYELVVKRFLAVLMPPAVYEEIKITAHIGGELFEASGRVLIDEGWRRVGRDLDAEEAEAELNICRGFEKAEKGMKLDINRVEITEGITKPPSYLTEASLLSAMEHPAKYMNQRMTHLQKHLARPGDWHCSHEGGYY